jgi:hypothetical protein
VKEEVRRRVVRGEERSRLCGSIWDKGALGIGMTNA